VWQCFSSHLCRGKHIVFQVPSSGRGGDGAESVHNRALLRGTTPHPRYACTRTSIDTQLSSVSILNIHVPSSAWPVHDIASANIVWSMAYTGGVGQGCILRNSRATAKCSGRGGDGAESVNNRALLRGTTPPRCGLRKIQHQVLAHMISSRILVPRLGQYRTRHRPPHRYGIRKPPRRGEARPAGGEGGPGPCVNLGGVRRYVHTRHGKARPVGGEGGPVPCVYLGGVPRHSHPFRYCGEARPVGGEGGPGPCVGVPTPCEVGPVERERLGEKRFVRTDQPAARGPGGGQALENKKGQRVQ